MSTTPQLKDLLPKILSEILEFGQIMNTEQKQFDLTKEYIQLKQNNFYIQTCDEMTLSMWEKHLGIRYDVVPSIHKRRVNILDIFQRRIPYSLPVLMDLLNSDLGVGNWEILFDYNTYRLEIMIFGTILENVNDLTQKLLSMIPCHINWIIYQTYTPVGKFITGKDSVGYTYNELI